MTCNKVLWLHKGEQVVFTDDVEGACDSYEEFLKQGSDAIPAYDLVVARRRIEARAAMVTRKQAAYEKMKADAAKLPLVVAERNRYKASVERIQKIVKG